MAEHPFNVVIVAQAGRLQYEALLFAASLARHSPQARLLVAEPQQGRLWPEDPRLPEAYRIALEALGARIIPFEAREFGAPYPQGNKIEALLALPEGEPFVFFDTDTLITGDLAGVGFDFDRPSASMRVEGTWPEPQPYIATYEAIWRSLYDRFGLDYEGSLDLSEPSEHWRRHLYFNAGWFFGACPREFGRRFLDYARAVQAEPGEMLASQSLWPWLDQICLPLVISSFGGGRPGPELAGLDGKVSCHYRTLPLLYARESDRVIEVLEEIATEKRLKPLLRDWEQVRLMTYQGKGKKRVRGLFDLEDLPGREQVIRSTLKREGLWLR